jgi:GT2 family glycosyltransferase
MISAIISNFNGLKFLPRLLESLRHQQDVALEIIVVDRDSTDGSREFLSAQDGIKVVSHPPQHGLVSGYSQGLRVASGEKIFFCNEDMWFDPVCLKSLVDALNPERRVIAADPWQWTYDGATHVHGVTRFTRARWSWSSPYPFRSVNYTAPIDGEAEIPYPCAGAFLIDRRVFEEVGGWDERFFLDHEDVDLGLRLWKAGWKTVSVPMAKVYHAISASNAQVLPDGNSVKGRRYVSNRANLMMIQFKHLWAPLLPAIGGWWALEVLKKAAMRDGGALRGALSAGAFVLRNVPDLMHDRARINAAREGLADFFTAPEFN